jgi:hypothetical protein
VLEDYATTNQQPTANPEQKRQSSAKAHGKKSKEDAAFFFK